MHKIAVLGCGRIGAMHAANLATHPRVILAGVFDIMPTVAQQIASTLDVTHFLSAEEIFASDQIDAVLIATPTPTHVGFIEMGVKANKAILCEKPIDLDLKKVDALKKRIAGTQVPIMLGFVRRFDPSHAAAHQALVNGEIGDLHQLIITSRDPSMAPDAYIESSGGIFRDMTIHDLDLARFMLREEVIAVAAHGSRLINQELMNRCDDYDTVTVTLATKSGKQAIITNSRSAVYGYDQRVELFGAKGMLISGNHCTNQVTKYTSDATSVSAPLQHFFIERYGKAFNTEIDKFVDVIDKRIAVPVGFEDGRLALVLAEACLKSIKEQRTVYSNEIA